ncbi:MAG: hypothetical protein ISEC1_P0060 [Thiomicrorhabdus sp.]|nr:MAG: hypothetical protein ISEC1_P0060 [Thiomicrorhabdus sp.]
MPKDQRSFYRIDVQMPCSYRVLSPQEAEKNMLPINPDAKYIEKYFMTNLAQLDEHINEIISHITEKSSLLAIALTAINSKINFVLETIDDAQLTRAIPTRTVNLSGSGIAIDIDENISKNDKVDLLIKPLEAETPILVRCDIIKITPLEHGNNVALSYQNLNEEDRRKLIFFIQSKEIELAQKKRQDLQKK